MRYLILFVGLSIGVQDSPLASREYKSLDSATGGFEEIYFQLRKEGKMFLIDSTAIQIGMAASGGIYKWKSDTLATGGWDSHNDSIFCRVKSSALLINSLFSLSTSKLPRVRINKNEIIFPLNTDTLYIKRIPCVQLR